MNLVRFSDPVAIAIAFAPPVIAGAALLYVSTPPMPTADEAPGMVVSVCDPLSLVGDQGAGAPIGLLEATNRTYRVRDPEARNRVDTEYTTFFRLSLYRADDGGTAARAELETGPSTPTPTCVGYSDGDVVVKGHEGAHRRSRSTLEITATDEQGLVDELTRTLASRRETIGPAGGEAEYGQLTARMLGEALGPERSVREIGDQTRLVIVDGEVLGATAWRSPLFLVHPPDSSVVWPDPPSLIVCEPREDGRQAVLTRVTLDGELLWHHVPAARPASLSDCAWTATGDGGRLFMVTEPAGLIGLDPRTGVVAFARSLAR